MRDQPLLIEGFFLEAMKIFSFMDPYAPGAPA